MPPVSDDQSLCMSLVWTAIEPFVEVSEAVALSSSCKLLRSSIVDNDTNKVKMSHFCTRKVEKNRFRTSRKRASRYLIDALNAVHIPSLFRLDMDFSAIDPRVGGESSNVTPVFNAFAKNIEEPQVPSGCNCR